MTIKASQLKKIEQIYSWMDTKNKTVQHIASGRLVSYLDAVNFPIIPFPLTKELASQVIERNGVEIEQIKAKWAGSAPLYPATFIDFNGNGLCCIDGNHSIIIWWLSGCKSIPGREVPAKIWKRFVIKDMPGTFDEWAHFQEHFNHAEYYEAKEAGKLEEFIRTFWGQQS